MTSKDLLLRGLESLEGHKIDILEGLELTATTLVDTVTVAGLEVAGTTVSCTLVGETTFGTILGCLGYCYSLLLKSRFLFPPGIKEGTSPRSLHARPSIMKDIQLLSRKIFYIHFTYWYRLTWLI